MNQPEPVPRPPIWVVGAIVLFVVGVLVVVGWRRNTAPQIEAVPTSLPLPATAALPPAPSTTTTVAPRMDAPDPAAGPTSFDAFFLGNGAEAVGSTLVAHIGQGDTDLRLYSSNGSKVYDMPGSTNGPIRFDLSRSQYAFTDSAFSLYLRQIDATADLVSKAAIATNVRSFAWSLDEAERIAWVAFDEGGPLLVEKTDRIREVGNPGDVDLVGLDSTGYYVFGGNIATPGASWLRKLTLDGSVVAELPADVVYIEQSGLILIGRVQPATVDGPYVFDWFVADQDLGSITPMAGPQSGAAISATPARPGAVAFLTYEGFRASIDIYTFESGLTERFDLGRVRAWDIQWSDDGRYIVVSGTEDPGRGHLVQLLDLDTGLVSAVVFDDWVLGAQLIRQPYPSPTAGGFDETAGCQPTIPSQPGLEVPGDRDVNAPFGVWYGRPELWTVLEADGSNLQRMSVWWSTNFPGGSIEESPDVAVTARRLDAEASEIDSERLGTNAYTPEDGWFMIADFPLRLPAGCWQVTGTYKGATLSYVVGAP